ncbi:MAG TPA: MotA/TolQ/ExbB proton channel family protein [Bacteroidales bacterium]|nr:MotA/TolQ/ExbB proton channel family protein [Bacteroidales bacterium]
MREFLITGGIEGMAFILILGIVVLIVSIIEIARRVSKLPLTQLDHKLLLSIPSLGGIALLFGLFYQILGLYQAFQHIQMYGDIAPQIIMGGVFVSFYSTLFGLGVGLISFVIWYVVKMVWR